jgi:hypothetical protein
MALLVVCSYCGGRLVWRNNERVHATSAPRIPKRMLTPGDLVSASHNRAGTYVGSYDVISVGGVKRYMIDAVGIYADNLADLILPYSLPAARWDAYWTIREARRTAQ